MTSEPSSIDPEPLRLELSELEELAVVGPDGAEIGELVDVIVASTSEPATVTALVVERADGQLRAQWDQVRSIDVDDERIELVCLADELAPAAIGGDEIALVDAVLDNQVLDVERRRFVRVQDVLLEPCDERLVVAGVDASGGAVMRRMGLGFLSRRWAHKPGDFVPWENVNLISVRLSRANFVEAFTEIADLHPADTLQEMDDELRTSVLVDMPRARAAAVLRHVDPDEAADILAELPEDVVEEVLALLPAATALALRGLASHPEHSAGALMTTQFVALGRELTAAQALARVREMRPEAASLWTVFVTDQRDRLAGAVTLSELVLADPDRRLAELMDDDVVRAGVETAEDEVGRLMTKYNLLTLPVTDGEGRLLGMVTLDDALDAIVPDEWKQRLPRLFA